MNEGRPAAFYALAAVFGLYVLFLYGPMIVIFILSFQGPTGGLTFPLVGVSLHWFYRLWEGNGIVDITGAFKRSLELGIVVMILTVVLSLSAGLAFRKRFLGANLLFYVAIASLIVPRSSRRSASRSSSACSTTSSRRTRRIGSPTA